MNFRLDKENHIYYFDNSVIPGVTEILENVGIIDFSMVKAEVLKEAQDKGKNVHEIFELYDKKDLDIDSLDDLGKQYLEGWQKFLTDYRIKKWDLIEESLCNEKYKYGTTPDRFSLDKMLLVEVKTGSESISWPIQLAAQEDSIRRKFEISVAKKIKRIAVIFEPLKYRPPIPYKSSLDFNIFHSALNCFRYKKK